MDYAIVPVSDFVLASVLASQGFTIDYLDKTDFKRVQFCFQVPDKELFTAVVDAFWRGEIRVEPRHFHSCQKFLKTRLYNER